MFGLFKRNKATWESKEIDRKYLFAELSRVFYKLKKYEKDEKIKLPEHLRVPAIRSKQINSYDIEVLGKEYESILKSKQDHHFGNFN